MNDLEAWHRAIVAANPGEVLTTIPVRENGVIVRHIPCYLPAWMRCDEREEFLKEVAKRQEMCAGDESLLNALHAIPGVPMRRMP